MKKWIFFVLVTVLATACAGGGKSASENDTAASKVEKTVYTHPGKTAISVHFFYGLAMKIQI